LQEGADANLRANFTPPQKHKALVGATLEFLPLQPTPQRQAISHCLRLKAPSTKAFIEMAA
jgi:hypothetical protein